MLPFYIEMTPILQHSKAILEHSIPICHNSKPILYQYVTILNQFYTNMSPLWYDTYMKPFYTKIKPDLHSKFWGSLNKKSFKNEAKINFLIRFWSDNKNSDNKKRCYNTWTVFLQFVITLFKSLLLSNK